MMPLAPKLAELRALSNEELESRYDQIAGETQVGLEWYREEIARRAIAQQTGRIVTLTGVITILTVANVAAAIGVWLGC